MELDAFDFDDDSTTMTSLEQAKAIEVVMWDYHDEREASERMFGHFDWFTSRLKFHCHICGFKSARMNWILTDSRNGVFALTSTKTDEETEKKWVV